MTNKEFKLSEKVGKISVNGTEVLLIKDVQEFIKRDFELIKLLFTNKIRWDNFIKARDRLTGNLE